MTVNFSYSFKHQLQIINKFTYHRGYMVITSAGHFISLTNFYSFLFLSSSCYDTELRVHREFEWAHTPFFSRPDMDKKLGVAATRTSVRWLDQNEKSSPWSRTGELFLKFTLSFLFCFADYGRRWWCCRFCHRVGGRNCALCYFILSALQPRSKNTNHIFFLFFVFFLKEICGLGLSRLVEPTQQEYISCYNI